MIAVSQPGHPDQASASLGEKMMTSREEDWEALCTEVNYGYYAGEPIEEPETTGEATEPRVA